MAAGSRMCVHRSRVVRVQVAGLQRCATRDMKMTAVIWSSPVTEWHKHAHGTVRDRLTVGALNERWLVESMP